MTLPIDIQAASTKEAVADALYRCVNGLDQADEELFRSAFVKEAKFTLLGKTSDGIEAIMNDCYNSISKLDTTHFITGLRVKVDGSKARLTATAMAQHYRPGTGMQDAPRLLSGSFYELDLSKAENESIWRITDWRMKLIWTEGDFAVLSS